MFGHPLYGPEMHGGAGFLGGLLWIVLFAAFIGLIVWAVSRLVMHDHHVAGPVAHTPPAPGFWGPPRDDALTAARIRYARGEIDRDQYFRVVEDLTGVPRPAGQAAPPPPAYPAAPQEPADPGTPAV